MFRYLPFLSSLVVIYIALHYIFEVIDSELSVTLDFYIFAAVFATAISIVGAIFGNLFEKYINFRLYQISGYRNYLAYNQAMLFFDIKQKKHDEEKKIFLARQAQERLKKERELKRRHHQYWISLNPYDFEKEIALLFEKQGYKANVTKASGDGGIDIVLEKEGVKGIVQCKRFKNKVGPGPIRDLYGTMKAGKYKFGFAVCPSGFSDKAYEFSRGKNINLIGLKKIMEMVE